MDDPYSDTMPPLAHQQTCTRFPVKLVGAGPGDPELLTIKAWRAIQWADVILVDDLVDRRVLVDAKPSCRITAVGKRAGCRSTPQAFIERLMVREALAGARVVRLKGGDPLIFGRAGEEIAALRRAGLQVEIINGVTTALAAAASLGISLTHRAGQHGVVFLTGHPAGPDTVHDWAALARSGLTLVIYMGNAGRTMIARALMAAGMDGRTPAGYVIDATGADERRIVTNLEAMANGEGPPTGAAPVLWLIGTSLGRAECGPVVPAMPMAVGAQAM